MGKPKLALIVVPNEAAKTSPSALAKKEALEREGFQVEIVTPLDTARSSEVSPYFFEDEIASFGETEWQQLRALIEKRKNPYGEQ